MPFISADFDDYLDFATELDPDNGPPSVPKSSPSGEFEYHAASARFAAEAFSPIARVMFEAVTLAGATGIRVRYDGGFDEGFAHPVALLFGSDARAAAEVLRDLATPELVARIRAAAGQKSMEWNATELYAAASVVDATRYALDDVAGELATKLLGEGFGTGEYELYGAFVADFGTGEIRDDPNAVPKRHR